MVELGTRAGETLEDRLESAMHEALDGQMRAGMITMSDRGLGYFDDGGADGSCVLSIRDLAVLLAPVARGWM